MALRIMTIYGTRPEAIKVAPVLKAFEEAPGLSGMPVVTGQHREMLDQALTASYYFDEDGVGRPLLLDCPIVLRSDEESLHVRDARGHMLVDAAGRRQVIEQDVENVRAPRDAAPYRLETADRRTVALSV